MDLSSTQLFPSAHDPFASLQRVHGYEWKTSGIGSPSLGITLKREFTTQDFPFCIQPIFQDTAFSAAPSQHRAHRPVWCRGPMSCLCWEVQRCHTLSGVPRSRRTWGTGWTDSRTNRTASRLLKLLGIPTSDSCWHDHLRFHNSPPIGVFVKSWEGHTSTSIRTSTTHTVTGPTSSCRDASWRTGRLLQQPSNSY